MNGNCNTCDVELYCGYPYKPCECCNYRKFRKREHITDGTPCWCNPETTYTDPETGDSVFVHKDMQ